MRAILFARATVTDRAGRRSSSPRTHAPAALFQAPARYAIEVAPSTSNLRISRLPALVIRPRRVLPPVECWRGTNPSQAAKCRAVSKSPIPSPTVAAISEAVIGPTPGIVARRLAVSSRRACATISASSASIRSAVARHCSSMPSNTSHACSGKVSSSSTSATSSSSLPMPFRSEEHTSELQSRQYLVCRLLLEKKQQYQLVIVNCHMGERRAQLTMLARDHHRHCTTRLAHRDFPVDTVVNQHQVADALVDLKDP